MFVKPTSSYSFIFTTKNLSTGAAVAADSLPVGKLYCDGIRNDSVTVTISGGTSGLYLVHFTMPGTDVIGPGYMVDLIITAVIGGVTTTIHYGPWQVSLVVFGDPLPVDVEYLGGYEVNHNGEGCIGSYLIPNGINSAAIDPSAVPVLQSGLATAAALSTVAGYVDTEIGTLLSRIPQPIPFTGTRVQVSLSDVCGYDLTDSGAFNFSAFFNNGGNYSGTLFGDFSASISAITNIATQTDKLTFNVANQLYADVSAVGGNTLTSNAAFNFSALFNNGGNATYLQLEDIKGLANSYTDALAQDLEAFVSSGRGANVVTVTVRDSVAAPLQGAIVRLSEGANSFTATTNASGVATFALDNATYTRSVTKAGYVAAPDSITVTGAGNFNLSMSATGSVSAPADPSMCRVYGYLIKPDGSIASNVTVKFKLQTGGPATSGSVIATREISAATNGAGLLEVDLIRNDVITPDGSYYTISCKEVEFPHPQRLELSTPTYNLSDLV